LEVIAQELIALAPADRRIVACAEFLTGHGSAGGKVNKYDDAGSLRSFVTSLSGGSG
jgi:hypothetical protein